MTDIIMIDSPEAAKKATVEGWVSRNGRFCGNNEYSARWDGCTHVYCAECNKPIPKHGLTLCNDCGIKKCIERYNSMPRKPWDENACLYSETLDEFFDSPASAQEALECQDEDFSFADLRLVICEPVYASPIYYDQYNDELPEDGDLPAWLEQAIDEFNAKLEGQEPLSWWPGKFALDLEGGRI